MARSLTSSFAQTVRDFVDIYPARPKTMLEYGRSLERFRRELAIETLAELTPLAVERYLALKIRAGRQSVARNDAIALKGFSKWATARGIYPSDPLALVRVPKGRERGRSPYRDAEVAAILRATAAWLSDPRVRRPYRDRAIVLLAVDSGMRRDEMRRLRWPDDVQLEGDHPCVFVREGKTEYARRTVYLDRKVAAEIRLYVNDDRPDDAPGPLFISERGTGFSYYGFANLAQNLRKRLEAVGIKGFMMHRLRNTKARNNRRLGLPDAYTKAMLGWEPNSNMPNRYAGLPSEEELRALPSTTSAFFAGALAQSQPNQRLTSVLAEPKTAETLGNSRSSGRGWS